MPFSSPFNLAYVARNNSNNLFVTTANEAGVFGAPTQISSQSSKTAPAFCCPFEIALAYVANNNSNNLLMTTSSDFITWTPSVPVTGQQSSKMAPALAVSNSSRGADGT